MPHDRIVIGLAALWALGFSVVNSASGRTVLSESAGAVESRNHP
jgi:hypothetical protein